MQSLAGLHFGVESAPLLGAAIHGTPAIFLETSPGSVQNFKVFLGLDMFWGFGENVKRENLVKKILLFFGQV